MSTSAEKLVKQTIKLLSKTQELDYEELKMDAKKVIKMAQQYDQSLLGTMEELLDLGNIGSPDELGDFNIDTLKVYCKIKELDHSGSERSLRSRVWQNIEEEFELDSDEESDDSEDESVVDSDESEDECLPEVPPPTPVIVKQKKPKKEVTVVE